MPLSSESTVNDLLESDAAKAIVEKHVPCILSHPQIDMARGLPLGVADTEGVKRLAPTPAAEKMAAESVPLQRLGSKQDMANCCLWLASPLASYISGAVIPVDGGSSLGGIQAYAAGMKNLLPTVGKAP